MATGWYFARSTPREGERRLHSAITRIPGASSERRNRSPAGSRPRDRAIDRAPPGGLLAFLRGSTRGGDDSLKEVTHHDVLILRRSSRTRRAPPPSRLAAACVTPSWSEPDAPRNQQPGRGVQHNDVASWAMLAAEQALDQRRVLGRVPPARS